MSVQLITEILSIIASVCSISFNALGFQKIIEKYQSRDNVDSPPADPERYPSIDLCKTNSKTTDTTISKLANYDSLGTQTVSKFPSTNDSEISQYMDIVDLFKEGRFENAGILIDKKLSNNQTSSILYTLRGLTDLELKLHKDAEANFMRAVVLDRENIYAIYGLYVSLKTIDKLEFWNTLKVQFHLTHFNEKEYDNEKY